MDPGLDAHPLSRAERVAIEERDRALVSELTTRIEAAPADVRLRSQRGDGYFRLGRFTEAVADYDQMVQIDPSLGPGHWRRGIALYYAGRFEESARQFDAYRAVDDVDRENGIWRFLAQVRLLGLEAARRQLVRYQKDDRPPLGAIYAMFAGTLEPEDLLDRIGSTSLEPAEREKRLFYAHLYLGLYSDAIGARQRALPHLRSAVANRWGREAGGGPGYMWHVARLHYESVRKPASP